MYPTIVLLFTKVNCNEKPHLNRKIAHRSEYLSRQNALDIGKSNGCLDSVYRAILKRRRID